MKRASLPESDADHGIAGTVQPVGATVSSSGLVAWYP